MTDGAYSSRGFAPRAARAPLSPSTLCAILLLLGSSAGLWLLYAEPEGSPPAATVASLEPQPGNAIALRKLARAPRVAQPTASPYGDLGLLDPTSIATTAPVFGDAEALSASGAFSPEAMVPKHQAAPVTVAAIDPAPAATPDAPPDAVDPNVPAPSAIPMPLPRPVFSTTEAHPAPANRHVAALAPVAPEPEVPAPSGFFEKMFGSTRPSLPALAYASPEDGGRGLGTMFARPGPDPGTAVYNIASHTVTLPNGTKLEAHSGLGARLDDPRSVTEHMRGATPPAIYDLTLRESLFHGVQALRLTPLDPNATYGRMGLLAHTFMLGPRGDSNGCVVFRDYQAFLRAYETGQIRRLAVVTGAV